MPCEITLFPTINVCTFLFVCVVLLLLPSLVDEKDKHFSCSFTYAAKPINVTEEEWRISLTSSPDGSAYSCHVFSNNERQGLTSEVAFQKFHLKIKGSATRYGYTEVYRDPDNKLAEEEYSVDEDNLEVTQVDGKFGNRLSAVVIVAGMPLNHEEL
uniref:Myeloid-derived growth factor n=1 Tax=Branchiostoma floridae TaxID=7739 RepID=C3YDK6_BRAFL|eukprot:XP_002605807.1 hypothetical protein BRAFLDRAFT_84412 [Branchiostoma floridae]